MRTHVCCRIGLSALLACGGSDKPVESPANQVVNANVAAPVRPASVSATAPESSDLVGQLKRSKLSLAQGIAQAEKDNGPAISAKFELEDGKLSLSLYTARAGLDKDAEHNMLEELSGDPTGPAWRPKVEVFEDKEHITRAAMHLTLVQRAKTTLGAVVANASTRQPGTVYSVTPLVRDKRAAFEVLVATTDGKTVPIIVD